MRDCKNKFRTAGYSWRVRGYKRKYLRFLKQMFQF